MYHVFFWVQLTLQSEALALIASYSYNNRSDGYDDDVTDNILISKQFHHINTTSIKVRKIE
jgi:hypothetical protein